MMHDHYSELDEMLSNADEGWYGYKALHGAEEEKLQPSTSPSNATKKLQTLDDQTLEQIIALKKSDSKIAARKLYIDSTGAGLMDSIKAVDEIWKII